MTTRSEAFNDMFAHGFDYQFYIQRSDRHQERMNLSYNATAEYLQNLDQERLLKANRPMKVLCIAENWCGDCGNGVPVIAKLAEFMTEWDFKIAPRDDYEEYIDLFYSTAGRKKIPIIVFADDDGDEINHWVERPSKSYELLVELQAKKLPKEEYIKEYRSLPDLKPPLVSQNTAEELLDIATKSATLNSILPKKR